MLKKIFGFFAFLLLALVALTGALYFGKTPDNTLDITDPFFGFNGLEEIYRGYEKKSVYITLRDSTQIAVDYFLPTDGPQAAGFPVIFEYTPYGRSYVLPDMPFWQRVFAKIKTGFAGPVYDRAFVKATRVFLSQGYAYVVADMRGSGASSGKQMPLWPKLGDDGKEIIDWITAQDWSDGNVGMTGQSFVGWSQFITAKNQPAGLKCLAPSCIMFETYSEGTRPGGITSYRWLQGYSDLLLGVNRNKYDLDNTLWKFMPATPVIDEDGDGRLDDEIPLRAQGDPTVFYDDLPFTYADGQERQHIYANNTLQHLDNFLAEELIRGKAAYIDAPLVFAGDSISFAETSPGSFIQQLEEAGIAVYNLGGWFDGFTKGTTKLFANLTGKVPTYLLLAPRFHRPMHITGPYKELLNYQGNFVDQLTWEQLKFFNKHLKQQDNKDFAEPVKIYTFHKGWEKFASWPPASQPLKLFFNRDQTLTANRTMPGAIKYGVNYNARANYGTNNWNRWLLWDAPDEVMERSQNDSLALVFETPALEQDVQVTGHPVIDLYLSSSQPDADVFVYLSDVDEEGKAWYVTEGQLRSDWHELKPPKGQVLNAEIIKPELPWHGYRGNEKDLHALDSGRVIQMRFDLMPASWVFKKGHKIRLAITGADSGNFILHPQLSAHNNPDECPPTTWQVYATNAFPSKLVLPVVETP